MSPKLNYPHKVPGKYNGTIIFVIYKIKRSSPINQNNCQTWTFSQMFWAFGLFLFEKK